MTVTVLASAYFHHVGQGLSNNEVRDGGDVCGHADGRTVSLTGTARCSANSDKEAANPRSASVAGIEPWAGWSHIHRVCGQPAIAHD